MWSAHAVQVVHTSPPIQISGTRISLHTFDLSPEDTNVEQIAARMDVRQYLKPEARVYPEPSMIVYVVDCGFTKMRCACSAGALLALRPR